MEGHVVQWLQHWGYGAIFVGVGAESAGIPFPGETIIVTATLLVSKHVFRAEYVYLCAVLGAVIGDNVGYALGHFGGRDMLVRLIRLVRLPEDSLDRADKLFQQYGGSAVFFGRFIAILRTWAGPLAGLSHMSWGKFLLFNTLGALVWAGAVVGLASVFGSVLTKYVHDFDRVVLVILAIAAIWFFVARRYLGKKTA